MPDRIPGSSHHPTLNKRCTRLKLGGIIVGEDADCSADLLAIVTLRIEPVEALLKMTDDRPTMAAS